MKKNYFYITLLIGFYLGFLPSEIIGQKRLDCGTKAPERTLFMPKISDTQRANEALQIKLFVHVFADDNGSNRAASDADILRQLENMQSFYAPMDICFKLIAIEQINSTDLNAHNTDHEESELAVHLIPKCMDIFVHRSLYNDDHTLNGNAYDIPNDYLSIVGSAAADTNNISTLAHEMGHCFGLYHTFETSTGSENATRSGGLCENCSFAGDLLCDTPADPHSDSYDTGNHIDANCNYTGTIQDGCGDTYHMDPHNIMAYGSRPCRDDFTSGQGQRMRAFINSESILSDCVSPQDITLPVIMNQNYVLGWQIHTARNSILVQGINYEISGLANGFISARTVRILPKTYFHPQSGSVVVTTSNVLCD